ncbi:mitochondrial amidoxime-reducing component 1-like [Ostrinia nubilalis]|uniref:mitochondrial amidoxime-reducing component 1-like n=2 Tax=Ostrinia TaxID=29056 RepID=UPI0030826185
MPNVAPYAAATAVGVIGGAYCAYRLYQQSQHRIPEQWTQVGTLKDIYVYPVKSCQPVKIEQVECTIIGLKKGWLRDRVLMVIDDANNFITARAFPELYLVKPTINNSVLTLSRDGADSIDVDLAEVIANQKSKTATVWGIEVPVYDCGDDASAWFTKLINRPSSTYRLAYYASQNCRDPPKDPRVKVFKFTKNDTGALGDDTSFNLINEASVQDLNSRVGELEITPRQFRPNFVLSGAKPYDEDNWKFVKIGENVFEIVMPCTRCAITTMDPETGARHPDSEPLKTLRSYRLMEGEKMRKVMGTSPRMGLQMSLRSASGGTITLNDPIYVA